MVNIEIYTAPGCASCTETKKQLLENNITFTEHIVGKDITRQHLRELFPWAKVLPVILMDGRRVENLQLLKG